MSKGWMAAALLLALGSAASAQTSPAPGAAGQARPARGPEQHSVPDTAAPPATLGNATTTPPSDPKAEEMNARGKARIEVEGK